MRCLVLVLVVVVVVVLLLESFVSYFPYFFLWIEQYTSLNTLCCRTASLLKIKIHDKLSVG